MDSSLQKTAPSNRTHTIAVILASLVIPAPILVSRIVEAIMDSTNPAGLTDLSAGLAYLTEILVWSFAILILVVAAFIVTTLILASRAKTFRAVALPVVIFVIQLVVGVAILILNQAVTAIDGS